MLHIIQSVATSDSKFGKVMALLGALAVAAVSVVSALVVVLK